MDCLVRADRCCPVIYADLKLVMQTRNWSTDHYIEGSGIFMKANCGVTDCFTSFTCHCVVDCEVVQTSVCCHDNGSPIYKNTSSIDNGGINIRYNNEYTKEYIMLVFRDGEYCR